ncbi:MAG: L,D-transpeptidase [Gaiella sp.]
MRRLLLLTAAVASTLVWVAVAQPSAGSLVATFAPPSRETGATVGKIMVATVARARPNGGKVLWRIPTSTTWGEGPQELLVLDQATDTAGRVWVGVRLPLRPNGTVGWIREDHVRLFETPYWIDVSRARREVSVYRDGELVRRFRAVVGASSTPTPAGLHAVYDPIRQQNPEGFIGPWALHLTAFSNVLDNYGGGPGRVAIHGRAGASLRDPLGTARSHGCIRVNNDDVRWLARVIPRGTPVLVGA